MDERTLTALKGSIAKWEAIVAGTGEDRGGDNCPLCHEFANKDTDLNHLCIKCPVYVRTKRRLCKGTPYEDWLTASWGSSHGKAITPAQLAAAQAELDFLKSLLPDTLTKAEDR